jgi:hypothetical protein
LIENSKGYSNTHKVHDPYIPAHDYFYIFIKPTQLPDSLKNQALIAYKNEKGKTSSIGGHVEHGYLKARARKFGTYYITIDSRPPVIKPLTAIKNQYIGSKKELRFLISDNLSGIEDFRATVDGNWTISDYEPKRNLLVCEIDGSLAKGEHQFQLEVWDERGNRAFYNAKFKK